MGLKVIKVTNIPLQVTKDQIYILFRCMGEIEDISLYPTIRSKALTFDSRICFIKYKHSSCVDVAPYLTNTHLMGRELQVTPFIDADEGTIPSERRALELLAIEENQNYSNLKAEGFLSESSMEALDPDLEQNGLPPYPPLPVHYTRSKVEQIRRTLVVTNLDSSVSGHQVIDHFSLAGEVKYVRFCKRNDDPGFFALVEFTEKGAIISGLKLNNTEITKGRQVKVYHSVQAIEKSFEEICGDFTQALTPGMLDGAHNLSYEEISAVLLGHSGCQSRSPDSSSRLDCHSPSSRKRSNRKKRSSCSRQSKSRSPEKRKRSRSREKKRSRSREKKRSRSKEIKRSRSSEIKRSRSKEKKRPRSRSREKKRSRSREKKRSRSREKKRSRSREKKRSRSKEIKRSRSKEIKRSRSKEIKRSRSKEKKRPRSRDKKRPRSKEIKRSRSRGRNRSRSRERRRLKSQDCRRSRSHERKRLLSKKTEEVNITAEEIADNQTD